jgi:alkylhydroperoxidase family enzyme
MPRIPYPDPATLPEAMRPRLQGNPANVTRMLARASEPVWNGIGALGGAFINGSPLPAKLREIAILRVGYLSNARYEVFQHEALARHVGLSDAQISAIKEGGAAAAALGEAGAAVLHYVDDLVQNVRASDATMAAVRRHLDDIQFVDLTLVSGMYMMISRFLETTGIELDGDPIDWKEMTPAEA